MTPLFLKRASVSRPYDRHVKKLAHALCLAATLTASETPLRSAPAAEKVVSRLPNAMLGYWCFSKDYDGPTDLPGTPLSSVDNFDSCANHGGVRFWQRSGKTTYQLGRFDWRANCKISKIYLVGPTVYRVSSYCRANESMFVGDSLEGPKNFELLQFKEGWRWRELEATKFDKYKCQVTEVVEDISTGKPKTLTPEYDLVLIEVAKNPPRMKVSHLDRKGNVAERNKQYRNGSYVLLSTDSTDTTDEIASPVFTLYGSRTVGSTIYRIVGKMTLDGEGPLYYGYYEEIHKDGSLDATIRAKNCSEKK
jgi:hypothetical protein